MGHNNYPYWLYLWNMAHESSKKIERFIKLLAVSPFTILSTVGTLTASPSLFLDQIWNLFEYRVAFTDGIIALATTNNLRINLGGEPIIYSDLSHWSIWNRVYSIVIFYVCLLALLRNQIRKSQLQHRTIVNFLKCFFGIAIMEEIVLPVYCGLSLNIGLLPLSEDATVSSRLLCPANLFLHWFVGHYYLSYCVFVRWKMGSGVLCKSTLYPLSCTH